jgi:hypothetical protein
MNRTDFINLLEDKIQVDRRTIDDVYGLIDLFPWFQSAHLLLLKGLKDTQDIRFEKQLKASSVHIADREILYFLLNRVPKPLIEEPPVIADASEMKDVAVAEETIPSEPVTADETDDKQPEPEPIQLTEPAEQIAPVQEITDQTQTVLDSAKNSDQFINEIEHDGIPVHRDNDETLQHSHSIIVSSVRETSEADEVMVVIDEEDSGEDDKFYYMDPGFSFPENGELLELETEGQELQEEEEITLDIPGQEIPDPRKQKQAELIDKFILTNPRIEPIRDPANLQHEDISKPYTENQGGFISETLAKIYITQGYYSRAIDIYEKLSLKFPEKSSYFATQIELVKEHLKK